MEPASATTGVALAVTSACHHPFLPSPPPRVYASLATSGHAFCGETQ